MPYDRNWLPMEFSHSGDNGRVIPKFPVSVNFVKPLKNPGDEIQRIRAAIMSRQLYPLNWLYLTAARLGQSDDISFCFHNFPGGFQFKRNSTFQS
jgi:hypothetical protein